MAEGNPFPSNFPVAKDQQWVDKYTPIHIGEIKHYCS